jgi:phosphomethylpyrimidine synthase
MKYDETDSSAIQMSTIMEQAARGESDHRIKKIAEREGVTERFVMDGIAAGRIVMPCNPAHDPIPAAVGEGLSVKVNANIGTSRDMPDIEPEIRKMDIAVKYGADAVMDLSTGGDIDAIRKRLLSRCPVMMGSVPIYEVGLTAARKNAVVEMTEDDIFSGIEKHAKDGMDFMTVHCGITRETVKWIGNSERLMDVVSRGGSFLTAWILHNDEENPLYKDFDVLLDLARKYEFTLSLGDGFRPGVHPRCLGPCAGLRADGARALGEEGEGRPGCRPWSRGRATWAMDQIAANMRMGEGALPRGAFLRPRPAGDGYCPPATITSRRPSAGGHRGAGGGRFPLLRHTRGEHLSLPGRERRQGGRHRVQDRRPRGGPGPWEGGPRGTMRWPRRGRSWTGTLCTKSASTRRKRGAYRARGCTEEQDGCSMCGGRLRDKDREPVPHQERRADKAGRAVGEA